MHDLIDKADRVLRVCDAVHAEVMGEDVRQIVETRIALCFLRQLEHMRQDGGFANASITNQQHSRVLAQSFGDFTQDPVATNEINELLLLDPLKHSAQVRPNCTNSL